jgi:signal transduction histidine kinase/CheY-like chemotaxis protein/GAF domain-containing protein
MVRGPLEAPRETDCIEEPLREAQATLLRELEEDTKLLQCLSGILVDEDSTHVLYKKLVDVACHILNSDSATMQVLVRELATEGRLQLIGHRGLDADAVSFWQWVTVASQSVCGAALREGRRIIVPDVNDCSWMSGSADLATLLRNGIRAVQTTPLMSRSGNLLGMISTLWHKVHMPCERELRLFDILVRQAADIIERVQSEKGARYRHAQFETLLNNAPLGVYLVDADFRIQHINPIALPVFGNIPNLTGRDFDEVIHILWEQAYADEVASIFRHTLLTGEAYFAGERAQLRADRQVTEYYEWQINRLTLPDGRHGVVCYFRDISEHIKAREIIAQSKERYQTLFESIDEGFCVIQMIFNGAGRPIDYRFLEVNPSFEFQTGLRNAVGTQIRELAPHHEEHWFEIFGKVAVTGEPVRVQKPAQSLHRWYDVYAFRIGEPAGLKVAVLFNDITERKHAEEQLKSSEESLRVLAAELEQRVSERTAELTRSQDHLRTLSTELSLAESRERKKLAADLHDHLQQILVLGKLQLGQGKRHASPDSKGWQTMQRVDDLLSDALKYTHTLVAELSPPALLEHGLGPGLKWLGEYMKTHDMTVSVAVPETPMLQVPEGHRILLFQSVRELLINARKHAKTDRAEVTLDERDGQLRIEVHDDGVGYDSTVPVGVRENPATEGSSKFGIFSIRERMKALGGSFTIISAPGQGTTATLLLPVATPVATRSSTTESRRSFYSGHPSTTRGSLSGVESKKMIRVLLVDDHATMRQGLRSVLESYPDIEIVGEASSGEQSVSYTEGLKPSVVIMDINMPGMNGIEATQLIKARHPSIAIIGLSVNAGEDNQSSMKQAGAELLLPKEAAVEQLYSSILHVLRK